MRGIVLDEQRSFHCSQCRGYGKLGENENIYILLIRLPHSGGEIKCCNLFEHVNRIKILQLWIPSIGSLAARCEEEMSKLLGTHQEIFLQNEKIIITKI